MKAFFFLRPSRGGSGGGHSHGLRHYSHLLNVKAEEFPDQVITLFFPANEVGVSGMFSAVTEKRNVLLWAQQCIRHWGKIDVQDMICALNELGSPVVEGM